MCFENERVRALHSGAARATGHLLTRNAYASVRALACPRTAQGLRGCPSRFCTAAKPAPKKLLGTVPPTNNNGNNIHAVGDTLSKHFVGNNGLARNMNVANSMCAVMFSLFLPRCAAREQDLRRKHPIYYRQGHQQRFERAATAFDEVKRVSKLWATAFEGP